MATLSICVALGGAVADEGRWVHPLCQPISVDRSGPFVATPDGGLMTVDVKGLRASTDEGVTWSKPQPVCQGISSNEPASFYLVRTQSGALVLVYLNFTNYKFVWDDKAGEPKDCQLEIWSIRSVDGGKTWIDQQRLLDGYNANFFGFIQTRKGRLVATVEHLVRNPGRWVVGSLISDDDGKTWKCGNWIDLGGHGHHDGATEPTVAELSDGRLLMLIRTNLDRFWQAFSDDGGRYWRTTGPSMIDASSSPGYLLRLHSGRLVLLWNRLHSQGGAVAKSGPSAATEGPASWYREELSLAFSENDGKSWTKPLLIAREKGGQLSYPYIFERRPGELWLTAGFAHKKAWKEPGAHLRLHANEDKLLQEANKNR
jgi:hypothetical protein